MSQQDKQRKQAEEFKNAYGSYPPGYKPAKVNYADSLKQGVAQADFNILSGKGTAQDSARSRYGGILGKREKARLLKQPKPEKPKTASQMLSDKKARLALEYSRLGNKMSKKRMAEARRLKVVPKVEPENYSKKIGNILNKQIKIRDNLDAKYEAQTDESGKVTRPEEYVIKDEALRKPLSTQYTAYGDSIKSIQTRQFVGNLSKTTGVSVSELNEVKSLTDQVIQKIDQEGMPPHIKDRDWYISSILLPILDKKYGARKYEQDDWKLLLEGKESE